MRAFIQILLSAAVVVVAAGHALAQIEPEPKNGRVTIPVTLTPSDVLKPISRCYLLPEFGESIQGNRVQMFLRCFMEQDNFFGQAESARRDAWNELPLKDLPKQTSTYGGRLLDRDMYDAARMTSTDWQLWHAVRRDGFNTLLPDVQKMRAIASVLKTRVRGEIAAGDFQGALRTAKTMIGLARTMESHPSLIGHLVGLAITNITVSALEEFIQQPGSPNLYWALMDLPAPFLSLRAGAEGERAMISHDFEALKTAADPVVDSVIIKKIDSYQPLLEMDAKGTNPLFKYLETPKVRMLVRSKNPDEVKAARVRLIQEGLNQKHVKVWSPLHVVLVVEEMLYEQYRDEMNKWLNLPFWQAKPGMDAAEAEINKLKSKAPFLSFVPTVSKVKQAQARIDQRIAYLQVMEAIRLHSFKNGGVLPKTLAEIKLPAPIDPVTGKAFEYSVKDLVATLHGANPQQGIERTNRYYEVQIKK